jgi:putative phosphoesterase
MRIAIVSDIHGNLAALEATLADLRTRAPDLVVNLGDCVTSPLWPRETYELLATLDLPTVRGNHDRMIGEPDAKDPFGSIRFSRGSLTDAQQFALTQLPTTLAVAPGVLAVHGTPGNDSEYLLEDKVRNRLARAPAAAIGERLGDVTANLILCGHSHQQHSAFAPGGRLVVNPGSVGCPRKIDDPEPERAEAGSPHARYAICTRRGSAWSVEFFVLAYDWNAAAVQAMRNGREDWARAFLGEG